jgi:hypothetical protein
MSDSRESSSYVAARAKALQALLHELRSRELTPEEMDAVAELAVGLRGLLEDNGPVTRVHGHVEHD